MTTQRPSLHLAVYIQEIDRAPMEDEIVGRQLQLVSTNPFGALEEMSFERTNKWSAPDHRKILQTFAKKAHATVVLRTLGPLGMSCSLSKNEHYNTINLNLAQAHFPAHPYEEVFDFMRRSARALAHFASGNATADTHEISDFYTRNNLPLLPPIFGGMLPWFALLAPHVYEPYYTRASLLAAPAFRVHEYDDGWLGLRVYEDPFDFTSVAVGEQIAATNAYLDRCRLKR